MVLRFRKAVMQSVETGQFSAVTDFFAMGDF